MSADARAARARARRLRLRLLAASRMLDRLRNRRLSEHEGQQLIGLILDRRAAWVQDGCRLSDEVKEL